MKCYVDDMIIKSLFRDHAEDLRECFKTVRSNDMKINLSKCTFRVASGKFLGYMLFKLSQITKKNNSRDDALSRLRSAETQSLTGSIYLTEVKIPSIDKNQCMEIHQVITWMTPILAFLEIVTFPLSKKETQKVRYRASYTIINGKLYRRSASSPLLRCLDMEEQKLALETVHEGICGEHLAGRALAFKILR
ncbi:uncharacterized protein LOC141714427 [Apium graveolens]|uniref:uncharacterized protein LOC141714427 n=1 Tax=Apium graveolens TaxID=4045 RepID=UPI003D79F2CC